MEIFGALKIFVERAAMQAPGTGILTLRNAPLGAVVLTTVVLFELSNWELNGLPGLLAIAASSVFVACSYFLPPAGHSQETTIIVAYLALLILLATSLVITFSRDPSVGKVIAMTLAVAFVAFFIGFVNTFSSSDRFGGRPEADVAVVLGGGVLGPHTPSPDLRARLDAAARLYQYHETKEIAVTGGTRRFHTYESEIGARYLQSIGIPESDIITEDKTENTLDQVLYIKRYLMGEMKMKNVVIVSDGWHLPRALLMCKWSNVKATGYASHYNMPLESELYWRFREAAGLQAYMLFGA